MQLGFGIEIEAVVKPYVNHSWSTAKYYEKFADALRRNGIKARADPLNGGLRSQPERYDKWYITSDGSLAQRPGCSKWKSLTIIAINHYSYCRIILSSLE